MAEYHFVSGWQIQAPIERVWEETYHAEPGTSVPPGGGCACWRRSPGRRSAGTTAS